MIHFRVFNDGKLEDELNGICEALLVGDQECYAEEWFGEDGLLILQPPTLDELWLSELGRRDMKDALKK